MSNELTTRPSVSVSLDITTIAALREFCGILAGTEMVPKAYINKPDNILVAMLHGQEVGLPHLQALQSIAVINGIPSIYGDAALSLVRASGLLEDFDEWIEVDGQRQEGPFPIMAFAKEERSIVALTMSKRKGMSRPRVTSFSVDDAGRAGLWGKTGPWSTVPQRMLMWRARSWNLRDNFGDVLKGLAIYEEAQDIDTSRNERGVYEVSVQEEKTNKARLIQVQEQLQAKAEKPQEHAHTGSEEPTSDGAQSPPYDAPAGGGPGHMTPQEWHAMLLYLDADKERMRVKNLTKMELKMKPTDKLGSLLAVKQVEFINVLMRIAKKEDVEIAF